MIRRAPQIFWDIYEEHLDEAAFLLGAWEDALVAANYTLDEVVEGPEERLLAHLDGLVLGGERVADKLLAPALSDDDPGKVFAAAWALLQAEDADHWELVAAALAAAEPAAFQAIARALTLSHRPDLASKLEGLWETSEAPLRALILDVAAPRNQAWVRERLVDCLGSSDAPVRAAALRIAQRLPDAAHAWYIESALRAEHASVRAEAIIAAFLRGMPSVWAACEREARSSGVGCRLPLALLALQRSHRDSVLAQLAVPELRRHAVWALGFAGDTEAVEVILGLLADEEVGRVAGESLSAITGVTIAGPLSVPGTTQGPDAAASDDEGDDDDPPPEIYPEDHLLVPNAGTLVKWWGQVRGQRQPNVRYVYGRPGGPEAVRAALPAVPMWRREVFCLDVAAATRAGVALAPRGWARGQE